MHFADLRIANALERRERENSKHAAVRLTAMGTLAGAVFALGAFLFSISENAAPPAININNTNGDNSGNNAGGDIVNGSNNTTRHSTSAGTSVTIPHAEPAPIAGGRGSWRR